MPQDEWTGDWGRADEVRSGGHKRRWSIRRNADWKTRITNWAMILVFVGALVFFLVSMAQNMDFSGKKGGVPKARIRR